MIVIGDGGVRYLNKRGHWVLATDARNIPEEVYGALPSWERFCILSHFASEGDEPIRYDEGAL